MLRKKVDNENSKNYVVVLVDKMLRKEVDNEDWKNYVVILVDEMSRKEVDNKDWKTGRTMLSRKRVFLQFKR